MNVTGRPLRAEQIVAELVDLESLPEVVARALGLLNDSTSSARDLANVISLDQGITAKVLATANSAYFGASRRFVSLREATVRLGYRNIRSILCAATVSSTLSKPVTIYGWKPNQLWKHSVACAIGARLIAEKWKLWDVEEAYVAGLLHDIGLPVLEKFVLRSGQIARLNEMVAYPPHRAEEMVFGFDHAHLGSLICQKWQLAHELAGAVLTHHDPFRSKKPTKLAAIVHIADVISLLPEVGVGTTRFSVVADPAVLAWLDLDPGDVGHVVHQVRDRLKESEDLIRAGH